MRKLCLSLLTSVLFILVFSCVPVRQEAISTADAAGLEETRAWFEATHQPNGSARSGGTDAAYLADVKVAWEKGKRVETKHSEGFSIPLSHNRVMWGTGDQFTEVPPLQLVVMEKNGERYAFLVVLQPDDPKNWSNDPKVFTGKVRVLDWEGHPVKGWIVKKGVITGRIFTSSSAGSAKNGRACMDFSDDVYECVYQGNWDCKKPNPDGVVAYSMTEQRTGSLPCPQTQYHDCKKYVLDDEYVISAEVTTVCDSQEEADLYGFMTFEQYTSNSSYSSGSGSNVNTNPVLPAEIDASGLTNECMKNAYERIMNAGLKSQVLDIAKSFGMDKNIKIEIINGSLPAGEEGATRLANKGANWWEITLSDTELANASQDYIAITILHEMLHVYLKGGNDPDHNVMAEKYVKPLAYAIKYAGYPLTLNDATALAWGGLQGSKNGNGTFITSKAWQDLLNIDRLTGSHVTNDIIQTNQNFKSNNYGVRCN
jgi:hypothetical protein